MKSGNNLPAEESKLFSKSPRKKFSKFAICCILGIITLAAFWPLLNNGFINFDDPEYVTENPHVLGGLTLSGVKWAFTTGHASNWHPITWLSHMLDVQLFGTKPGFHHAVSLGFHVANTILLFLLLARITKTTWRSAAVAALFGVHPLHVESVAWVAERKDVLSGFFFLLTLLFYARFVQKKTQPLAESRAGTRSFPVLDYSLASFFFLLGLMSKPMLVTLPFVLLLLDFWPLRRFSIPPSTNLRIPGGLGSWLRALKCDISPIFPEKILFFALVVSSSVVTYLVQQHAVAPGGLTLDSRVANAFFSYFRYLEKFFWPAHLAIFYPHPATANPLLRDWISLSVVCEAVAAVGILLSTLCFLRAKPYFSVGLWWFFGMLVPVIGFIQVGGQAMADRYSYLPMIGLSIAIIWAAWDLLPKVPHARILGPLLAMAGLSACLILTHRQVGFWLSSLSIFNQTLQVTQNNATAHFNFGAALEQSGDLDAAMGHYQKVIETDPFRADGYYNLGHALATKGHLKDAEKAYRSATELQPDYVLAHHNLGTTLYALGNNKEAEKEYAEAIRLKPNYPLAHSNLGKLLCEMGRFADGEEQYRDALLLEPNSATAETGLGLALVFQQKYAEALPHLRHAVILKPNNTEALVNLGNALFDNQNEAGARDCYAKAVELQPSLIKQNLADGDFLASRGQDVASLARYLIALRLAPFDPTTHEKLGLFFAQRGKIPDAITNFLEVVRLRPDAQAHYNLALAYLASNRHREAISEYEKTLIRNPEWPEALNDLAWILATDSNATLRNGSKALRLAQKACALAITPQARFYGTLDAAFAELGQFVEARETATKTIDLAKADGQKEIAAAATERLRLYESNRPYHQQN